MHCRSAQNLPAFAWIGDNGTGPVNTWCLLMQCQSLSIEEAAEALICTEEASFPSSVPQPPIPNPHAVGQLAALRTEDSVAVTLQKVLWYFRR